MKRLALVVWMLSIVAILADPAPVTRPIQLRFIQSDVFQADLLGAVKSVDETSYKSTDGTKGESEGRSLTNYDGLGCYLESSRWDKNGNLEKKTIFAYDGQGNLTGSQDLDSNGGVVSKCVDAFDQLNHQVTCETKSPDGTLQSRKTTVFDSYGKEHEIDHFDAQGNRTRRATMDRDTYGKETSIVFYGPDNQPQVTISVTWNPDGSQATESIIDHAKDTTTDISYDYPDHDPKGNWTTRVEKSVYNKSGQTIGDSTSITERVMTYYN